MAIRVLIVDDHQVVRRGFSQLFPPEEVEIVGEVGEAENVAAAVESQSPEVVMLDVRLGDRSGLDVLAGLKDRWPELPVLMFTNYANRTSEVEALNRGAAGFYLKDTDAGELLRAIRAAAGGERVWKPSQLRNIPNDPASLGGTDVEVTLTPREREILERLAQGMTNKEIGRELDIGFETVKEHVQNLLRKIGVSDRTQAVLWALRQGLV